VVVVLVVVPVAIVVAKGGETGRATTVLHLVWGERKSIYSGLLYFCGK